MTYSPGQAVANARANIGVREGNNNWNIFTPVQTQGRYNYQPYCCSAISVWTYNAGFRWDEPEHPGADARCLFGPLGDWNVSSLHQWALRQGLWRSASNYRAQPGDPVIESFGIPDQHVELAIGDSGGNIATIAANSGPFVTYRSRPRYQVVGIVALTQSHQVAAGTPPVQPKELHTMGMTPGKVVPGSHRQDKAPWKGRFPFVAGINNPDGTSYLAGFDGATISGATAYGPVSLYALGHLAKPLGSVDAIVDEHGNWDGMFTGLAADGGDFTVRVHAEYI